MDATEHVSTLLTQKFGVDPLSVRAELPLRRLRLDSLALEELRLLIEDRLEIDLEDVELTSRDTVGQLMAAVQGRVAA